MSSKAPDTTFVPAAHVAAALASRLVRPVLWPQIARYVGLYLRETIGIGRTALRKEQETAAAWCEERAVDASDALAALGIAEPPAELDLLFPKIIESARARIKQCPLPLYRIGLAGPGDTSLLYSLCAHLQVRRVLETGVAFGWSSLAILLALRNRPDALLVSTDMPYLWLKADDWVGAAVPEELRARWILHRLPDRQALLKALKLGPFDLCHYDSDKSVRGRLWAYPRLWAALRPGGILVSDDIGDNLAWRAFCEKIEQRSLIVRRRRKHVGILVKPSR
jgi:predicted O-methyltransferase YrrM